jgi:hypothetical protein
MVSGIVLAASLSLVLFGCATGPKSIPDAYYQKDYYMSVDVVKCSEKPQMADSGGGGLIGLMVKGARAKTMKEKMEGIRGDAFKELLRQNISQKLEDYFEVVGEDAELATEISIVQWGWFLPTTAFGIKTGSYQFVIGGEVKVFDNNDGKKTRIASVSVTSAQPMGNDPTKDASQEALLKAIEDFSNQAVDVILANGI